MDRIEMCEVLNSIASGSDFSSGKKVVGLSNKSTAAIYKALFELGCNANSMVRNTASVTMSTEKIILDAKDKKLLEYLKEYRTEVAKKLGCKAYLAGTNRSLEEMAYFKPILMSELMEIHGVGEKIADEFGEEYISIINDFIAKVEVHDLKIIEID
jgi:superfamily II DNA helicase RecQ